MLKGDLFHRPPPAKSGESTLDMKLAQQLMDVIKEAAQFSKATTCAPACTPVLCSNRLQLRQPVMLLDELMDTTNDDAWRRHIV